MLWPWKFFRSSNSLNDRWPDDGQDASGCQVQSGFPSHPESGGFCSGSAPRCGVQPSTRRCRAVVGGNCVRSRAWALRQLARVGALPHFPALPATRAIAAHVRSQVVEQDAALSAFAAAASARQGAAEKTRGLRLRLRLGGAQCHQSGLWNEALRHKAPVRKETKRTETTQGRGQCKLRRGSVVTFVLFVVDAFCVLILG